MSKGDVRRTTLFKQFSPNLALWRPEFTGQYVCPLCLRCGFTLESALGPQPVLTEEHCIPQGLGHRISVLTCDQCNNTAGHKIDHSLYERLDFEKFWKGTLEKPVVARLTIFDKEVGADLVRTPNNFEFRVRNELSNPRDVDAQQRRLREGHRPEEFTLTIPSMHFPSENRSRTAVLKAAYLLIFRHFGYGYILSPALEPVRSQIRDADSEATPLDSIIFRMPIEKLPTSVCSITEPEGLKGFGVPVPLRKKGVGFFVIMPSDTNTYDRWAAFQKERDRSGPVSFWYQLMPEHVSLLTEQPYRWNVHPKAEEPDSEATHDQ